jgi:hypothetical protein
MNQPLIKFRDFYLEALLSFLWRQWSALGISSHNEKRDKWIIDPESLLLFTCTIGRYDPRLFDEMLAWLDINGHFINIQRLRTIISRKLFAGNKIMSAIAALMSERSKFIKWSKVAQSNDNSNKMENLFLNKDMKKIPFYGTPDATFQRYGFHRSKIEFRHHSNSVHILRNTSFLFRLRALFGINARAEIFAYLLTHESGHPRRIARDTFYSQKTIQDILIDLINSGLVFIRPRGKEKHYWIKTKEWFNFFAINAGIPAKTNFGVSILDESDTIRLSEEFFQPVQWITWPLLLSAFEQIWLRLSNKALLNSTPLLQSSQLRILMQEIKPKIQEAGLAYAISDDSLYQGKNYISIFYSDIKKILG